MRVRGWWGCHHRSRVVVFYRSVRAPNLAQWLPGGVEEWRSGGLEGNAFGRMLWSEKCFFHIRPPHAAMHMLLVECFGLIVELLVMM